MEITKSHLRRADKKNVLRLAKWLKIDITGLLYDEIINAVYWFMKFHK